VLQDAARVAKEIARPQDPSAVDTFKRACQLLNLRDRPLAERAQVAVELELMTNTISVRDYVANLKPVTGGRTATARQRPTVRATDALKLLTS
jgi:hypothetical protein